MLLSAEGKSFQKSDKSQVISTQISECQSQLKKVCKGGNKFSKFISFINHILDNAVKI